MAHFSDAIVITSPKHVTKLTSQDFSILGPFQAKFLAPPVPIQDLKNEHKIT